MPSVYKKGGKKNRHGNYRISFRGPDGRRRTQCAWTTDHATALRLARQLENEATEIREGLVDPKAGYRREQEGRPLSAHLDEYRADIVARGRTRKYAADSHGMLARLFSVARVARIGQINLAVVQETVFELHGEGDSDGDGVSLCTCNKYITAAKAFSKWLAKTGRTDDHALAFLSKFDAEKDPRYERRDLLPDELARLIKAAEAGANVTQGKTTISGPSRAMLYRVAAGTGFRASELRSLTVEAFDLEGVSPAIAVRAAYTKNGKEAVQPISGDLASLLRPWLARQGERGPVFNMPRRTAEMMRVDLETAGIAHRDEGGHVVDFHGLRHTYVSRVVESTRSVKVAQELARHSTPVLTIGRYAHTQLHDVRAAVESVPIGDINDRDAGALRATGTDHHAAEDGSARCSAQRAIRTISGAAECNTEAVDDDDDDAGKSAGKSLSRTAICNDAQRLATGNNQWPRRDSNPNSRLREADFKSAA